MNDSAFYKSILSLPKQCSQAFVEANQINIPQDYRDSQAVVVCGMGGSALGPQIIGEVFARDLTVPYLTNREYGLPFRVDEKTLVILSSYSGTTEEVLSCGKQALTQGAKVLSITTGADLKDFSEKNGIPYYEIEPRHNPSGQPRMGVGYVAFGILSMLTSLEFVSYTTIEVEKLTSYLLELSTSLGEEARLLASQLKDKVPILIGAQHLKGAVHTFNNCLNETADNFTAYFYIPELDHHLLEGFNFPEQTKQLLKFVFVKSSLYSESVQKRFSLTRVISEEQGYESVEYQAQAEDKLSQAMEVVLLGEFVSFYLAQAYGVDPTLVPQVEGFKRRLGR